MPGFLRIVADNAVQAVAVQRPTVIQTPFGTLTAQPEDWVVQDYLGRFEVYDYDAFNQKFNADPADPLATPYFNKYKPAAEITRWEPTSGLVGTSVYLNGIDFRTSQGTSKVYFGIAHAIEAVVVSWSDTAVVVTVPAGLPTTYPVEIWAVVGGKESNRIPFTVTT